ncbi:MAG: lipid-A-disaccharide synthase, partial [Caulobacteraceae bacterium]|nr:lipid-A-disaccharide synthase [Caulobacteraceae bacterium]
MSRPACVMLVAAEASGDVLGAGLARAIRRRLGEDQVRFVGGANFEDRSLACIAEVPQGAIAW